MKYMISVGLLFLTLLMCASAIPQVPDDLPARPGKGGPPSPGPETPIESVIVKLKNISANESLAMLQSLMRDEERAGVSIASDSRTNSIIMRGQMKQILVLQGLLQEFDTAAPADPNTRYTRTGSLFGKSDFMPPLLAQTRVTSEEQARLMGELAALEAQSADAAKAYRAMADRPNGDPKVLEDARERLVKAVEQAFDKRHSVQEMEVKQIKDRLAKVEGSLSKRAERKKDIIAKRVQELLDEDQELRWDSSGNSQKGQGPSQQGQAQTFGSFGPNSLIASTQLNPVTTQRPPTTTPQSSQRRGQTTYQTDARESNVDNGFTVRQALMEARQELVTAEARWKDAEKLQEAKAISKTESDTLRRSAETARDRLALLQREFEAQGKLLQLDVEAAQSLSESAQKELEGALAIRKVTPNAVSDAEIAKLRGVVEQRRYQILRAQTLLELHQSAAGSTEKKEQTTRPASGS